ncbi:class I SAM-dependent methyltransferase [Paenibacillus kobensis]|uniref:class I SAM-dependent methyltransferase n=1 Tax=Paenibacillus kobensis TaxID=59841 RepID=UPI000FDBE351|nr:class I SAM-dependent methyltransferase [Paenibacillus kobensis]
MSVEWYDLIARRNGGYKSRAVYTTAGKSAEPIFEERLRDMLPQYRSVLDAGCGHGDFTLRMAQYAQHITGFDNSTELLSIAQSLLHSSGVPNVSFVYATTKTELPFKDGQFDLIYDRRGPTSILDHGRILASGGTIFGIHTSMDKVRERLAGNGFKDVEIEEYHDAVHYFPNEQEFAKFMSDVPGNPDLTRPEHRGELEALMLQNRIDGELALREHKFIWKAIKP